jgi:hypothetical protein
MYNLKKLYEVSTKVCDQNLFFRQTNFYKIKIGIKGSHF